MKNLGPRQPGSAFYNLYNSVRMIAWRVAEGGFRAIR